MSSCSAEVDMVDMVDIMACAVCMLPMEVPSFCHIKPECKPDDDELLELFPRLQCGHAFHTSCIIPALLSANKCPTCRSTPVKLADFEAPKAAEAAVAGGGGGGFPGLFIGGMMEDRSEWDAWLQTTGYRHLVEALDTVRGTVPAVQEQHAKFQDSIKGYNVYVHGLRARRAKAMRDALSSFRSKEHGEFQRRKRKLERESNAIARAELIAVQSSIAASMATADELENFKEDIFGHLSEFGDMLQHADLTDPAQSPLKRRFWTR